MDTAKAEQMMLEALDLYGLHPEWTFRWTHSVKVAGQVKMGFKNGELVRLIEMSKPITEINAVDQVMDTVWHEIAHILVGLEHHHNHVWQAKARELGAVPRPAGLASGYTAPPSKYVAYHLCGAEFKRNRLPDTRRYCNRCAPKFGYGEESVLVWERRDNGMLALTAHIAA